MLQSLTSGLSGLQQFQNRMDVIGNNIANSNTVGFKASRAEFEDAFNQSMGTASGTAQIGSGVSTGTVQTMFQQGSLTSTGKLTDLAIEGNGFFVVKDPASGEEFATRDGSFELKNGYLVNDQGFRLQGFGDAALSTRGDIQIDGTGKPAGSATATVTGFYLKSDGTVRVTLSDQSEFTRGQVLLQNFSSPQSLQKAGGNLYSGFAAAGALAAPAAPGSSGLGQVQSSALEMSNVDLSSEFADLITAQRGFQASARMITTSDELLQEIVNLKR